MIKVNNNVYIYSFYRFLKIENKKKLKSILNNFFEKQNIRGTILIADEGINASISGNLKSLTEAIKLIKKILNIRKLNIKINKNSFLPFNRIKVRLKKEIVSLGKGNVNVNINAIKFIHPSDWITLIKRKDIKLIDTRNVYETKIGRFKNAIDPGTSSFREFPEKLNKIGINKNDKLALYCTGGIRCEKASAYLKSKGFKNIFQLEGGILNYLNHFKDQKIKPYWNGECFVFDNRVTVDQNLNKGKYEQCYGCRHPITKREISSKKYKKGVYCPFCFDKRTTKQIKRSQDRQKQINQFRQKNY